MQGDIRMLILSALSRKMLFKHVHEKGDFYKARSEYEIYISIKKNRRNSE